MNELLLAWRDVTILRDGDIIDFGNSCFRRRISLADGKLRTVSLCNVDGRELAAADKREADFWFIGYNRPGINCADYVVAGVTACTRPAGMSLPEHAELTLTLFEPGQQLEYRRSYRIIAVFPGCIAVTAMRAAVMPRCHWSRDLADEEGNGRAGDPAAFFSCGDSVKFVSGFTAGPAVEFTGRTDYHDELVCEHPRPGEYCRGNLLFVGDDSGAGALFIQESPPSAERRDFEQFDFRCESDGTVSSCGWGLAPGEVRPGRWYESDRRTLLLYRSRAEADLWLRRYQRLRSGGGPDGAPVTVNPWGSLRFPKLVDERFTVQEIAAAADLGATHYQIDDGWQRGEGLRSLFIYNHKITPEFWSINKERFPHGFEPVAAAGRAAGVEPSLWIAPSANCEYRDWRDTAKIIMDFYHRYGICVFKLDAVLLRTDESQRNLEKLMRYCRRSSVGRIRFHLDITNGQRGGFFLFPEYGELFLENRYVCNGRTGQCRYRPEQTLRTLWQLAGYIPIQRLLVEIPSPEEVLPELYFDGTDPRRYPADYWGAVGLFSNLLYWFSPSLQSRELLTIFRQVTELHLQLRKRIFAGEIFPIGQAPDGSSITGFQSHDFATGSGLLLLFCEHAAPVAGRVQLHPATGRIRPPELLHGGAKIATAGDTTEVRVCFERPGSWLVAEYSAAAVRPDSGAFVVADDFSGTRRDLRPQLAAGVNCRVDAGVNSGTDNRAEFTPSGIDQSSSDQRPVVSSVVAEVADDGSRAEINPFGDHRVSDVAEMADA